MQRRSAPPRRYEVLAYILERGQRGESCPSVGDLERRLKLRSTRIKQLIDQLVNEGVIEKTPGAHRNLVVRDIVRSRSLVVSHLHALGAMVAQPLGVMQYPCPKGQLPVMPPLEHLPDLD